MDTEQPGTPNPHPVTEWIPGTKEGIALNLGAAVLSVLGLVLFTALYIAVRASEGGFTVGLGGLALLIVAIVLVMIIHEGVHGIAMAVFGARPRFGAQLTARVMPVLYCTATGVLFTKAQFLVIALAPFVVLNLVLAGLIGWMPGGGWLVVPAALHLGGCIGDLWMAVLVARLPTGTMVEDLRSGMRFHQPVAR